MKKNYKMSDTTIDTADLGEKSVKVIKTMCEVAYLRLILGICSS